MSPLLRTLAAGLAVLLCLAGCRSTEDLGGLRTQVTGDPESYDLVMTGNASYLRGTLQRAAAADLADFEARDFARSAADDAAFTLETFYRERGHAFATVTYALTREPDRKPRLEFSIDEGPRCLVGAVRFEGATRFGQDDLAKRLTGPTDGIFGLGALYYVEGNAADLRASVENLYYENGYLDVRVEGPRVEFDEARTRANLTYSVVEGVQYRLHEVRFEGLDEAEQARAREALQDLFGRPFFPRLATEVRARTVSWFARNGYPDAEADASTSYDAASGAVDLVVTLARGDQVRISELRFEGNERTRDGFLRQRVELAPGDLYDRNAVRRAFGELYATGLFREIHIDLLGDGPTRPLRVRVVEADSLSLSLETGYGAFERTRVLVALTEENLAGTGRRLSFEGKLAERAESLRVFLTDPWTLGKKNVLGATTFYDLRQEPGFDRKELGTGVNVTRPFSKYFRNVFGYEYRISDADDVQVDTGSSIDDGARTYVSAIYTTQIYDSRDSVFLPTRGAWARVRTELAPSELFSHLNFVRVEGRAASYHPLGAQTVLAWTVSTGLIFPIQDTVDIPLQERFFNGGQNSVRSFRESELGPKDADGTPVGGETYTVASIELRRKLWGSFTGALFVDAGNVGLETGDYLDFSGVRYGVGPGVRWLLPIGPLRVDWGVNPDPAEGEADWVVQFSVGVAF